MTVELERKDGILAYASSTDGPDPPPAVSDLEVLQGFFSFWDEASNFSDPVSDTFLNCRNFAYSHNFSIPISINQFPNYGGHLFNSFPTERMCLR